MLSPLVCTVWLLLSTGLSAASTGASTPVTDPCTQNIRNDTIAFFSSAPLTFSYNSSIPDCAARCSQRKHCQAWLYTDPGECQLYRRPAVAIASNPNFFYGACGDAANYTPSAAASQLKSTSTRLAASSTMSNMVIPSSVASTSICESTRDMAVVTTDMATKDKTRERYSLEVTGPIWQIDSLLVISTMTSIIFSQPSEIGACCERTVAWVITMEGVPGWQHTDTHKQQQQQEQQEEEEQ
ncbi:hypothetical protein ASPFODRAFT_717866 [Aspergillus luchuensis CBS 106.47]|uniref:Apple domain-containing protein n=1 Tax=Aspergillus luchuensis (strain CBS 106.47) TaxID=1137211 RepID=A0A1M3TFU6_ASPLC|nr:hypothetical protein ASPFODRAFT_717866 [Aspergillus luchuensis CBS 106.47]